MNARNPRAAAAPELLDYQRRWIEETAGLAVMEKGRRIGISWATAAMAALHAAANRGDVWYQAYSLEMAREFIRDAAWWAGIVDAGARAQNRNAAALDDDALQKLAIVFKRGCAIRAIASSARAWRGKGRPGDIAIVDEAAHLDDLDAVLRAALATRVWGGAVRVISTHNGAQNPFARLVGDVRSGAIPGAVHRVSLDDALRDGLYARIAAETGAPVTPAGEAAWKVALRAEYGSRAGEELDCIPAAGSGAWLDWGAIRACEHPEAGDPKRYAGGPVYIGIDQAIREHLWIAWVIELHAGLAWTREIATARGGTFADRDRIVERLVELYAPVRIAADQTGIGERSVEEWKKRWGRHRVEGVQFSAPRKLDMATALRERIEDSRIRIPADDKIRADLHSVRAERGPTGNERLVADATPDGHADRFWAAALACAAAAVAVPAAGAWAGAQKSPARRRREIHDAFAPRALKLS